VPGLADPSLTPAPTVPRRSVLRGLLGATAALLTTALPRSTRAFGDDDVFAMGILRYDSPAWNPRPTALRRLMLEVEVTTSVLIGSESLEVDPTLESLFQCPLVVLAGDRGFDAWPDDAREAMRAWLSAGGTLFIDSSEGRADGDFDASVRRELAEWIPSSTLEPVPSDHVLFKSFYLVGTATGRTLVSDATEGMTLDDRLAVIYSRNDHMGAWARDNLGNWEYPTHPGGEDQRDMAVRFGVNMVMYALCLDYKADQVHVPFILQRRRWRVDP
jgi:hypothetical protein